MSENQSPLFESLVWPLEGIFFIHCLVQFFVEFVDEDENEIRDLTKIALNYVYGDFPTDFISLLPL